MHLIVGFRGVGEEGVDPDQGVYLPVVVHESQTRLCKAVAVHLMFVTQPYYLHQVTVSQKIQLFVLLCPVVVVLRDHQSVAGRDLVFFP